MPDYTHHHFVPKSYLKEFGVGNGNDLKVFTQKISLKEFKPENINIGNAIGQIENFYRINTEDSLLASQFGSDPNIIEKEGFYYEKYLPHLFKKLREKKAKQVVLNKVETDTLINALISIKYRNPFVREGYMKSKPLFDEIVPKLKNELLEKLDKEKKDFSEDGKELFDNGIEMMRRKLEFDFNNHEEFIKTIHSAGMHLRESGLRENMNILGTWIINSRWEIVQTSPDKQFITSDNPGVLLSTDRNVYSIVFGHVNKLNIDRFFFPLSPLHGLLVKFNETDIYSGEDKFIQCVYSPKSVFEYNTCHCCHVNNILISASKIALEETFKHGKGQWVDVKTRV